MALASQILFAVSLLGLLIITVEVVCLWQFRHRPVPRPTRFPSISILKPLCGLDDELRENLESHLSTDYPASWEMLLGLRSEQDPAYPIAKEFVAAHPERARLVMQEGDFGHNPKVNQLITLTERAQYEVISVTDSNVRVPKTFLREIAAVLERPDVGIATNLFAGVGERRLGAILDNLTLTFFGAPNLAASLMMLHLDEVVGKSMAMRREHLEQVGGWRSVKDKLAEDQQLGLAFRARGLHMSFCPSPIANVQVTQPLSGFWGRQSRWMMIRYRTFFPGVLAEPLFLPALWALLAAPLSYRSPTGWIGSAVILVYVGALIQLCAWLVRDEPFRWYHLLLEPLREALYLGVWVRGATMRSVVWRGTRFHVLKQTRLAAREAIIRAKNIQKLGKG